MDELKEHIHNRLKAMHKWCEGAKMCSERGRPLWEFADSLEYKLMDLADEVNDFA